MRNVVITGLGVVSPLGCGVETYWRRLLAGESGVSFVTEFDTSRLRSDIAARVTDFDASLWLTKKEQKIYGKVTQFSYGAAIEAMDMAGLGGLMREGTPGSEQRQLLGRPKGVDVGRIGCLMSTGQGSVDIFEQQIAKSVERGPRAVSPFFIPGVMPNSGTALVSMRFGLMGPSFSLASACATGTHSIATSAMMIQLGEADIMLAGGAEAAIRMNTMAGFGNARALTKAWDGDPTKASRPFDKSRRGFVMGEGAGALILEDEQHANARGATILARLSGYGLSSDGQHLTSPHPEGAGLRLAIQSALRRAELSPSDIDYINPHATSTKLGDVAEVKALRSVFGGALESTPMSATKSMTGHMLGGAGAAESIAVICSLRDQHVHQSINIDEVDPALGPIDVVQGSPRDLPLQHALKLSAGFGGHNCALVFSAAHLPPRQ